MCVERLTISKMERKYPNEWLFICVRFPNPNSQENRDILENATRNGTETVQTVVM